MLPILFRSIDQGAPVLNNAAGAMIAVLDACLVTGFNTLNVTSLVVASNICTVTTATNHGLSTHQRVTITGATTSSLNGDKTITSTPTTTTFTFAVTEANTSESPGSCTLKRTSLGWVKEFSGTNKAIYKMSNPQSYGQMLRVDDTAVGLDCRVHGVESATSVDNFTDKFPTEAQEPGGCYLTKGVNNTTAKFWAIVGDDRFFYIIVEGSARHGAYPGVLSHGVSCFGDIISFKPGEAYGSYISMSSSTTSSTPDGGVTSGLSYGNPPSSNGRRLCRSHTGLNKSVLSGVSHPRDTVPGTSSVAYPSPIDNGLLLQGPSLVMEALSYAGNPPRGVLPGFIAVGCTNTHLSDVAYGEIITTTDGSNKRIYLLKNCSRGGNVDSIAAFDLTNSWR